METVIGLFPLLFMICAYAVFIKLAAHVMRRTRLSWKHAFIFGVLVFVLGVAATFANVMTGQVLPLAAGIAIAFGLQLALGGWYLGTRARTAEDEPVGFRFGALLSLLGYAFTFALGLLGAFGIPVLLRLLGAA